MRLIHASLVLLLMVTLSGCRKDSSQTKAAGKTSQATAGFCDRQLRLKKAAEAYIDFAEKKSTDPAREKELTDLQNKALGESLEDVPKEIEADAAFVKARLNRSDLTTEEMRDYASAYGRIQAYTRSECGFDPVPKRG